jgi:hypothetical protein
VKALEAGAVEMRGRIFPLDGKPPTLLGLDQMNPAKVLLVEEDAASRAGMIAKNHGLAAVDGRPDGIVLLELGDRDSEELSDLRDLGFADADEPSDHAAAAATQAFEFVGIFVCCQADALSSLVLKK